MFVRPAGSRFIAAAYTACASLQTLWAQPASAWSCIVASQAVLAIPFGSVVPLRHFASSSGVHSSSSISSISSSRNLAWLPDTSAGAAAAATHSAEESFKAAEQAELDALVGVGLNSTAAEAVRKAWYSGQIKSFSASSGADTHLSHRSNSKATVPARRLLVHLRQILTAHQAAAASAYAAADSAPAAEAEAKAAQPPQKQLQQLAVNSRRRRPAKSASAAQSAVSSLYAATGKLDWGLLDIQRILAADPALIMVPVNDLSDRLGTLLNGIAPLLGPDLAVHYVYKSPRLRSILGNPEVEVQHLQDRYDEYVNVLGLPPRASLLAASESSHVSNMTVHKFRKKLEQFVERWGSETAHATLSGQPHLLSSSTTAVDSNSKALQQLLGCSEHQLERIVRKAPRVLSTQPRRIAYNLSELTNVLRPLDLDADDVRKMVIKLPHLLVANPVTVAAKLEGLKELLGPQAHRLRITISQQPSLLASSTDTLIARCEGLQELLGCDKATVGKLLVLAPVLGSSDLNSIAARIEELTKVLNMPLSEVKALCCRESNFMVLRPELVGQKLQHWADTLGVQRSAVVKTVLSYPRMITYNAEVVSAHMLMLQALVQRGWPKWANSRRRAASRQPKRLSGKTSATSAAAEDTKGSTEPLCSLDHSGYRTFYREAVSVLKSEHPELSETELVCALEEHWRQYKQQRQQQQQQQQQQTCAQSDQFSHRERRNLRRQQQQQQRHNKRQQQQEPEEPQPQQLQLQQPQQQQCYGINTWPLQYSQKSISGRLLLRLEYLLTMGLQQQASPQHAYADSQETWDKKFPDFNSWVQVRLQHLQQDPACEWPPVLLEKAVRWYSAKGVSNKQKGGVTAAGQAGELSKAGRLAAKARAAAGSSGGSGSSSSSSSSKFPGREGARSGGST